MSAQLQHARDADAVLDGYTGLPGEIVVSTTDWRPRVGDGSTLGGRKLALQSDLAQVARSFSVPVNLSTVSVAATFTALSYANNGGNVQLQSAGAHGLTAGNAVGRRIRVIWAGGSGAPGNYVVNSVDSPTAVTVDLAYGAGFGTPTVFFVGGSYVTFATLTIPGGTLGPNGALEVLPFFTASGTAESQWNVNGAYLDSNNIPAAGQSRWWRLQNRGNAAQNLYSIGDSYIALKTYNTASALSITMLAGASAANTVITLHGYLYRLIPG